MTDVAELLDPIVPRYEGAGDWDRVVHDAGATRRPLHAPLRLAVALAAMVAIAGVVAFWPTSGSSPSVLDRALAATGTGQVLHLVYEIDPPHALVNLETGERTEIHGRHEVWFDPQNGLRDTETFDGVVQSDSVFAAGDVPAHATDIYASLGAGYRSALESGDAQVVGENVVDGMPVYWIRIADGHDVAVSRETYKPVTVRVTQGGEAMLDRIVTYETVASGTAPLDAPATTRGPTDVGAQPGDEIELTDARDLLGREAVWAGANLHGFPLSSARELRLSTDDGSVTGVSLFYGSASMPHAEINEAATPAEGLTMLAGVRNYAPPEGTALLSGSTALLRSNGLVVAIVAPDETMAMLVARALVPYTG
jgi:hypothetical protein